MKNCKTCKYEEKWILGLFLPTHPYCLHPNAKPKSFAEFERYDTGTCKQQGINYKKSFWKSIFK